MAMQRTRFFAATLILSLQCCAAYAVVSVKSLTANIQKEKNAVDLGNELNSFFKNGGCVLPKELTKKLDKKDKAYIPGELKSILASDLAAEVDKYSGQSVLRVLNTAFFIDTKSRVRQLTLTGAETYTGFDPLRNMDTQANNFAYAMDCSGFLNSSISVAGGISGNDGAIAAKNALETKKSMLAVKASVFSPVALALAPDIGGNLTRRQRISVLYSLSREIRGADPAAPDSTKVSSGRMFPAVWISSAGASSFQGQTTLSGNAGAGIGVLSASANTAGNATFSKSISFSQFDTYIVNSQDIATVDADLKTINEAVAQLVNATPNATRVVQVDQSFQVAFDLPRLICQKSWTIRSARTPDVLLPGTVQTADGPSGCEMTIRPAAPLANDETGLVLEAASDLTPELKFVLKAPMR
jgi:hypothetical protein